LGISQAGLRRERTSIRALDQAMKYLGMHVDIREQVGIAEMELTRVLISCHARRMMNKAHLIKKSRKKKS
jgi:hypothetical protein